MFFVEEPSHDDGPARLAVRTSDEGVTVVTPHLPVGLDGAFAQTWQRRLIDQLVDEHRLVEPVCWYDTPVAIAYTDHLASCAIVYDCVDELAGDARLLHAADLVLTSGQALHEAKRARHPSVHLVPSSVDVPHFARARHAVVDPPEHAWIPRPRVGFSGVIDGRLDLDLLEALAGRRPDLQLVMIGPVVDLDPRSLPELPNLHWLGRKSYDELPEYLAGWDVAILPFVRNDATRFLAPTQTLEYLAAGRPVVSTSIAEMVLTHGELGLAWIADTADDVGGAIDAALDDDHRARIARADAFLADRSWDRTWAEVWSLIELAIAEDVRCSS